MTASAHEILAIAAVVWDQDTHSEADMAFLAAIARADKEWLNNLSSVKITFGPGDVFEAVKCLATRQRNAAYVAALAELESHDDEAFGLLQAAE